MKTLFVVSLASLLAVNIAQAAECQPIPGADCQRNGSSLSCKTVTCDPPKNNRQSCRTRNTLMLMQNGQCVITHSVGVYTQSVEPPEGNVPGTEGNVPGTANWRCAQLTEAQRARTEGCR